MNYYGYRNKYTYYLYLMIKLGFSTNTLYLFKLRKMEKDRISFTEEKKCRNARRLKMIETLRIERNSLRDRMVAIEEGPHAKRTKEVFMVFIILM